MMTELLQILPVWALIAASCAALGAGFVKGIVGFGMPMIIVSSTASFLSPELAIAALIMPTLATNGLQAFRQGIRAALQTVKEFAFFLILGGIILVTVAQWVTAIPTQNFYAALGVAVCFFSFIQLVGWTPSISGRSRISDAVVATFAGITGGMSGIWGPPTVAYLTAINTPKKDQIRIQGVIYGLGAVALMGAHMSSGLLTPPTYLFSALLVVPAFFGTFLGLKINDRIDQTLFKKATLIILMIAGLNLLRRGVLGA